MASPSRVKPQDATALITTWARVGRPSKCPTPWVIPLATHCPQQPLALQEDDSFQALFKSICETGNRVVHWVSLAFIPYALSTKDVWIDTVNASAIVFSMYPRCWRL